MKRLFYLLIITLLSSCLGDDSYSSDTLIGAKIHDSVITTNYLAFDPANVAVRFTFLLDEAGGFDKIESDDALKVREELFGSQDYCTITELEPDKKYKISYHDNFQIDNDLVRRGSFIITIDSGASLFESDAEWTVSMDPDDVPYLLLTSMNASLGADSEFIMTHSSRGKITYEGRSRAYNLSSSNPDLIANWEVEMTIDFGSVDYSYLERDDKIELWYEVSGRPFNNYNDGNTITQDADGLVYDPSCSPTNYIEGEITTINPLYYESGNTATGEVTVIRENTSGCNSVTVIYYNGYAEAW